MMPILGLITILLTLTSAFIHKKKRRTFIILLIAVLFLIASGLTTKFGNQPINSIVITWDMNAAPANWTELRDKWWIYHKIKTTTSLIALLLIVWASIKKG